VNGFGTSWMVQKSLKLWSRHDKWILLQESCNTLWKENDGRRLENGGWRRRWR
jgi:hypothetical protein